MSKRLITDHDVQMGRCGARIVLDGETLITPSARDRALRLGITVVEAGDATGALAPRAQSPGAQSPACAQSSACAQCGTAGCPCHCATCGARPQTPLIAGVPGGNAGQTGSGACGQCGSAAHTGDSRCVHAAPHGFSSAVAAGLPDGLYLVRIEGGRAVSTLPAAGPGLMPRAHSSRTSRS